MWIQFEDLPRSIVGRVYRLFSKKTKTNDTETIIIYTPWNNSPLEKISTAEPGIEPRIFSLVGNDVIIYLSGRTFQGGGTFRLDVSVPCLFSVSH